MTAPMAPGIVPGGPTHTTAAVVVGLAGGEVPAIEGAPQGAAGTSPTGGVTWLPSAGLRAELCEAAYRLALRDSDVSRGLSRALRGFAPTVYERWHPPMADRISDRDPTVLVARAVLKGLA